MGSKGTFVDTALNNFNNPEPSNIPFTQSRRPYPQYGRIRMMVADGNTIFHSLQARFEHRFSHGLSLTSAYTWGHLIDDTAQTINRGGCGCQNPRNRGRAERADSTEDIRHRLVTGYVWEIPWGGSVLRRVAIGRTRHAAERLAVQRDAERRHPECGVRRMVASAPVTPVFQAELDEPGPFALVQSGRICPKRWRVRDCAAKSRWSGQGLTTFDLSLSKSFRMPWYEGHELLFRTEFFNAFNTPQFGQPGSTLGTGTFGACDQHTNRQPADPVGAQILILKAGSSCNEELYSVLPGPGSPAGRWLRRALGATPRAIPPDVYKRLGLRPIINAAGTYTHLGGSLMPPEVIAAMNDAAQGYVPIRDLTKATGERIAQLTGNEAALVTTGAAGRNFRRYVRLHRRRRSGQSQAPAIHRRNEERGGDAKAPSHRVDPAVRSRGRADDRG